MFTEPVHSRREVQKQATRETVLSTAYQLFRTQGFADTSIRAIAASANVSVGTVMGVGDKRTLLIETVGEQISAMHAQMRGQSTDLLEVLTPFLDLFTGHEELSRAFGAALIERGDQGEALGQLESLLVDESLLRLDGALEPETATEFAQLLYHVYLGLLLGWAAGLYSTAELQVRAAASLNRLETLFGVK
ncbi:TetR/AcrR family transcriptional regulator [Corynebacterium lizhenjunii]|uniref:TetR/AcrR family transcriptional regulator n=1 Tax=Corynebacterium lizhenjunii TaxID=2709394 RepID=UPI0013E9F9D9|nr:TetR/AcrR family transcriptional regulator [Corynebacterium lizhenjunii]